MQEEFVSYKLSLKLKNIGFDEPSLARYRRGQFELYTVCKAHKYNSNPIVVNHDISAPLWQQALLWIDSKFYVSFWVEPCGNYSKFPSLWEYKIITHDNTLIGSRSKSYQHEQKILLDKLIELIEKNEIKEINN